VGRRRDLKPWLQATLHGSGAAALLDCDTMTLSRSTKLKCTAAAIIGYLSIALCLKYTYVERPRPPGEAVYLGRHFHRFSPDGFYYSVRLPAFRTLADTETDQRRSPILLYENDQLLGPAHTSHHEIYLRGHGRFSHWMDGNMIFSTSDNSDPNRNGRNYWAVKPE
jgi:hypothetical protein